MSNPSTKTTHASEFFRTVRRYPRRLVMPFLVVAVVGCLYAAVRPNIWEASQALFVRNEAFNGQDGPGEFRHNDEMKITQETILEIALSHGVLAGALEQLGPSDNHSAGAALPSPRDVGELRKLVKLAPPKGAEFGTTEVFYLKVKDRDSERSKSLAEVICDQLDDHFQRMRDTKASSMIAELVKTIEMANAESNDSTRRLAAVESEVGSDLAELRILHQSPSDASDLRRRVVEMESELRTAQTALRSDAELLELLRAAQNDMGELLATPSRLLESQPALRRLKDGLIDAQLRTAALKGTHTDAHPLVKAALAAEEEIGRHIHDELEVAIRGLKVEHHLTTAGVDSLKRQLTDARGRLENLASLRADYSNLVAEVDHHNRLLEEARRDLTEAKASLVGARTSSLIGRLGLPVVGADPLGPSRALLALAAVLGGLMAGGALVFLTVPVPTSGGETRGDGPHTLPKANAPAVAFAQITPQSSSSLNQALAKAKQTGASLN